MAAYLVYLTLWRLKYDVPLAVMALCLLLPVSAAPSTIDRPPPWATWQVGAAVPEPVSAGTAPAHVLHAPPAGCGGPA
jgi:hypothetical protein